MKKKIKNAWEWTKEHKKEIGLGALAVITTVGGVVLFKKFNNPANGCIVEHKIAKVSDVWSKQLYINDIGVGALDDAKLYEQGCIELWMDDIPLTAMGELGETIWEHFENEGITKDSEVWALLDVSPKRSEVNT